MLSYHGCFAHWAGRYAVQVEISWLLGVLGSAMVILCGLKFSGRRFATVWEMFKVTCGMKQGCMGLRVIVSNWLLQLIFG